MSLAAVWDALTSAGLAFDHLPICDGSSITSSTDLTGIQSEVVVKKREGVFPLSYLGGIDAMFIAIADSGERAIELYEKVKCMIEVLEKEK